MKKVNIKYNPYLVKTEITIDGKLPKINSSLMVGNKRIQEWVDSLPQILLDEYKDSNISIEYTGTTDDYEDVQLAFKPFENKISIQWRFNKAADIKDVEDNVEKIFAEIQNGPIKELKDKSIVEAFQKAQNSQFEINVVATMSSGKSTLINALLAKQLMPAANEATTATIVKIADTDQEQFSATAYNKSGNKIEELEVVTLDDMKRLNSNESVSIIEIKGRIPFISSVGKMKLVLVDTPGPNNSRDKQHEEMTYKMLADSDKSLVLYVMNAQQLGINDEKIFLDYVCKEMKEGGKQARDRFIFVVNKMDAFKPKDEGIDCIERALNGVKKNLEERGIGNPNIFPVTAAAALEKRIEDDEPMAIDNFRRGSNKYVALHFENYYEYSHLPQIARQRIEKIKNESTEDDLLEIHTGIISIEQAICLYINKYARTTKIYDLVQSFNSKLEELSAVANLEDAIRKDKSKETELKKQIQQVKEKIKLARYAKTCTNIIDGIKIDNATNMLNNRINSVSSEISNMINVNSNWVNKDDAIKQCNKLQNLCKSINIQLKVDIESIIKKSYKETIEKILEEYKKHLSSLNMGVETSAFSFNPLNLVSGDLANVFLILEDNTKLVDEGNYITEKYQKKVKGGFIRKTAHFLSLGLIEDHTFETAQRRKWESKYVDKVDMKEVYADYLVPFRKNLNVMRERTIQYIEKETDRLKEYMNNELSKINDLLDQKLNDLSRIEIDSKETAEAIVQKERNLKWLTSIQTQVNGIIKF